MLPSGFCLNDRKLNDKKQVTDRCQVLEKVGVKNEETILVPPIACAVDPPIPDYSPPFWTLSEQCGELRDENSRKKANKGEDCSYPEPATWLSVIGFNRFWPMASLTKNSPLATRSPQATSANLDLSGSLTSQIGPVKWSS